MSLLSDYEERTAWKYEPIRGMFHTHEGLAKKVNADGSYAPFRGSTVVFEPEKQGFQEISLLQRLLYQKLDATGMLAAPLPEATIHMTLHDLLSPETCAFHSAEEYDQEIAQSVLRASNIAADIRREYAGRRIGMVSDRIVNMVSKSLVLLLKPETEQDYELLLEMYRRFDGIQSLPYPLTPHITLAYFRPGTIDGDTLGAAVDSVQISRERAPVFDFFPEGLTAQRFLDMQTYSRSIPECF